MAVAHSAALAEYNLQVLWLTELLEGPLLVGHALKEQSDAVVVEKLLR